MRILLVEDEDHKATDLKKRLDERIGQKLRLSSVGGVREAVLEATGSEWDLIVLDIALPTFTKSGSEAVGGQGQNVGGLEVLRALQAASLKATLIIVTQYPDILLNGRKLRLSQIPKVVSDRYSQTVIGALLYEYSTTNWQEKFDRLLEVAIASRST